MNTQYIVLIKMANDNLLLIGGALILGVLILKPDILDGLTSKLPEYGEEELIGGEGDEMLGEDLDGDGIPDIRTPNTIADETLTSPLKAVNYYAGKIAGMIASMAARNIFDATQLKEYLIDRHVAEVEHIAQLVGYKITSIDYTNLAALREIAKLCLNASKELRIEFEVNDALALEVLGNVGRGYSTLPPSSRNEMVLGNVSRYLMDRFNGAPSIRIPNDQKLINEQYKADYPEGSGMENEKDDEDGDGDEDDEDDKDGDDRKKKGNFARAMRGFTSYPYYGSNDYFDLNSGWQEPLPSYGRRYPIVYTNPFSLHRHRGYERPNRRYRRYPRHRGKYYNYNRKRYNYWWWY